MQAVKSRKTLLFAAVAALTLLGVWLGDRMLTHLAYAVERGRVQATSDELAQLDAALPELQAVSRAFKLVAKLARPGVVHIRVSGGETGRVSDEERDRIKEHLKNAVPEEEIERWLRRAPPGSGSGIIFDGDGYILTNNHVVEGREQITVVLDDEREFPAKTVGTDPKTDLAVIKIDAPDLHPLKLGDSDALEVGDWVIAVGSPFGLQQTVTHGIVSAKGRTRVAGVGIDYQDFIQTDAAINPGNSGGPLLNLRGEVVGVNTAIATHGDGVNAGVAFTIPSNLATKIASQLKTSGSVQRGWLGVTLAGLRPEDVEIFKLPGAKGVLVDRVLQHSPAEDAGLQVEDVVVAIDDVEVTGTDHLRNIIADLRPYQRVRLRIFRDGEERPLTVRLGLQPENTRLSAASKATESREIARLGLQVRTLRAGWLRAYDEDIRGVVVMDRDAEREGAKEIEPFQVVVGCNGQPVKSVRDLNAVLKDVPKDRSVKLDILLPTGDRTLVEIKPQPK